MYAYMIISSISVRQYLSFPLKYSAAKMAPGFVQIPTNIRRIKHHLICKQIILKIKLVNRAEKRPINSPLLRALLALTASVWTLDLPWPHVGPCLFLSLFLKFLSHQKEFYYLLILNKIYL